MSSSRKCTKVPCGRPAVATLTYAYAERAVVVGPLAMYAEPHAYDLCARHALGMTAPRGWEVVRLSDDGLVPVEVNDTDDLLAVVEAVRERPAHRAASTAPNAAETRVLPEGQRSPAVQHPGLPRHNPARRDHLRVVPTLED